MFVRNLHARDDTSSHRDKKQERKRDTDNYA